jgi:hypothetical protein
MRRLEVWLLATVLAFHTASAAPALAGFFHMAGLRNSASLGVTKVLVLGNDNRRALEDYAAAHRLEIEQLKRAHAASGLVECGDSHGAGQLTLSNHVITTAAHVFFDEHGARRAKQCEFVAEVDGKERRIPIDGASIVAGAVRPYATKAVHDWAVARLSHSIPEIAPYDLAPGLVVNEAVEFVARGHSDWGNGRLMSFEDCRLRALTDRTSGGSREFSFDCNTGDGASGGAVLLGDDHRKLGAILVGWRSDDPMKTGVFSTTHYNFVVSIEGAFRRALDRAAMTIGSDRGVTRADQRMDQTISQNKVENASRHRSMASTWRIDPLSHH